MPMTTANHALLAPGDYEALGLEMRRLALLAGAETLRFFGDADLAVEKKDDDSPVTAADQAADKIIVEGLAAAFPDIAVVSEERAESHGAAPDRFFLVDPLDGTKEFVTGRGEYTVNIALIEQGAPVLGAVFAPALKRLFWTPDADFAVEEAGGDGAEIDWERVGDAKHLQVRAADNAALAVVASKSHRDQATDDYIARYKVGSFLSAGSSLKFCLLAGGEADLYPRLGRTMEWDTGAAHAVLRAAGGRVDRFEKGAAAGPLVYGKAGFENPHFIAYAPSVSLTAPTD